MKQRRPVVGKPLIAMDLPSLPLEGAAPRLTRSAAARVPPVPLRSQSDSGIKSSKNIPKEETVKEKKQQLPLHRALQKAANLSRGMYVCVNKCTCLAIVWCFNSAG